jgi:hypothetical protein
MHCNEILILIEDVEWRHNAPRQLLINNDQQYSG